jgi:hypothetical protein
MKTVAALMVVALLLIPGIAMASSATDAALGLGAFAVFNQIISGTGIFGAVAPGPVVVAPAPVYVAPPVVVAPPPPRYVVAPRPIIVAPAPVYVHPAPVYVRPTPVYVRPAPVYVYPQHPRGFYRAHGRPGHWQHDGRWR